MEQNQQTYAEPLCLPPGTPYYVVPAPPNVPVKEKCAPQQEKVPAIARSMQQAVLKRVAESPDPSLKDILTEFLCAEWGIDSPAETIRKNEEKEEAKKAQEKTQVETPAQEDESEEQPASCPTVPGLPKSGKCRGMNFNCRAMRTTKSWDCFAFIQPNFVHVDDDGTGNYAVILIKKTNARHAPIAILTDENEYAFVKANNAWVTTAPGPFNVGQNPSKALIKLMEKYAKLYDL